MPNWFSWPTNLMLGVPALIIATFAAYFSVKGVGGLELTLLWATAATFVGILVLSNYFSWRRRKK